MKINIQNIDSLIIFLNSIVKYVPSIQLILNKDFSNIKSTNGISRAFFTTNILVNNDINENIIYINDLSKFIKLLYMLKTYEKDKKQFQFDIINNKIVYDGICKFSFKLSIKDIIEKYITNDIKSVLNIAYTFKIPIENYKSALNYFNIFQTENSKIYLSADGKFLYGEIDCKQKTIDNELISNYNTIKIPLCNTNYIINDLYAINLENFKTLFLFDEELELNIVKEGIIIANNNIKLENNLYIKTTIYCPLVKPV